MDQSITIKIAGKEYSLKASSPEMEQCMRLAAEDINKRLSVYNDKYPDKQLEDKLAFVTLNETVSKIHALKKADDLRGELGTIQAELVAYLDKETKK